MGASHPRQLDRGEIPMNSWTQSRPAWLAAGAVLGLIVGLNLAGVWPSVPLHATATQGLDKFAIATGLVDETRRGDLLSGFPDRRLAGRRDQSEDRQVQRLLHSQHRHRLRRGRTGCPLPGGHRICRHAARPLELPVCQEHRLRCRGRAPDRWPPTRFRGIRRSRRRASRKPGEFQPLDVAQFRTAFVRDEQ